VAGLEEESRAPRNRRRPEITQEEKLRVIRLRKENIRYGKEKLAVLYREEYGESLSAWKIYRVIREYDLYWSPVRNLKLRKKRKRAQNKKRITELRGKVLNMPLVEMDTKVIWCQPNKRYLMAGIEKETKIAFARMYKTASSVSARDFLLRMRYLLSPQRFLVQSDNGSEFLDRFEEACKHLGMEHYFSRVKTPKDHPDIERFNRTVDEEFLQMGNYLADPDEFNRRLTEWLIKYNFKRPHQTLGYMTPMKAYQSRCRPSRKARLLPMYSTHTGF